MGLKSGDIKQKFDSEPVYNNNYLKIKMKCYGVGVTGFHDKKIPKLGSNHTCLAIVTLDFALKKRWHLLSALILKECKLLRNEEN